LRRRTYHPLPLRRAPPFSVTLELAAYCPLTLTARKCTRRPRVLQSCFTEPICVRPTCYRRARFFFTLDRRKGSTQLSEMARAHAASGADMVTVAVRRSISPTSPRSRLDYIPRDKCSSSQHRCVYTADEAFAPLGSEGSGSFALVKLEVIATSKRFIRHGTID